MQFRKNVVFSIVTAICKFGITYILPNNSWFPRCFRSARLVVYSVHAQCMQRHASMAIRCLGSRPIIPGARWCMVCVSLGVSGCAPSPPSPGGGGKAGRLSSGSPCATTHSLLRLPAKHRPIQHSTQVHRTGNARNVCSTAARVSGVCSPQHVLDGTYLECTLFTSFRACASIEEETGKVFHALSGTCI